MNKKDEEFDYDNEDHTVVVDESYIDTDITIDEIAYVYRYSGNVDCEYVRLMSEQKLLALLYNIAVGLFPTYKYSTVPYRQYLRSNLPQVKILHQIKVKDIFIIKQKLCR
jgi:hypothetical protein